MGPGEKPRIIDVAASSNPAERGSGKQTPGKPRLAPRAECSFGVKMGGSVKSASTSDIPHDYRFPI
jgi:hypothetical protein